MCGKSRRGEIRRDFSVLRVCSSSGHRQIPGCRIIVRCHWGEDSFRPSSWVEYRFTPNSWIYLSASRPNGRYLFCSSGIRRIPIALPESGRPRSSAPEPLVPVCITSFVSGLIFLRFVHWVPGVSRSRGSRQSARTCAPVGRRPVCLLRCGPDGTGGTPAHYMILYPSSLPHFVWLTMCIKILWIKRCCVCMFLM